jgi:hypothetical protein
MDTRTETTKEHGSDHAGHDVWDGCIGRRCLIDSSFAHRLAVVQDTYPPSLKGLRVRLRMSWMSDLAEEQISHSEEDHGFGDVEALLVIADQPALCI